MGASVLLLCDSLKLVTYVFLDLVVSDDSAGVEDDDVSAWSKQAQVKV